MDDPLYRMLGLCMKAGRLLSGSEQVSEGLRKGTGKLLIIAETAPREQKRNTRMQRRNGKSLTVYSAKKIN